MQRDQRLPARAGLPPDPSVPRTPRLRRFAAAFALAAMVAPLAASATPDRPDSSHGFLATVRRHTILTSTVPANGDQNPYAIAVSPVSSGNLHAGDVLVDNFNDKRNLQGLGTTIVAYAPGTKRTSLFASVPRKLAGCPGGVGLTTAMTVLESGYVIVGSLPSEDGTTATKGAGCLIVLDSSGRVATTFAGPQIDGPWGNMAVADRGTSATLFVSNAGFGVGAPRNDAPVVKRATVLRLNLTIPSGKPPRIARQTVVADGFGSRADKGVFIVGPTGLALANGTLYISDAIGNRIAAIPDAETRGTTGGTGREIAHDGLLERPLALALAPNGHLLTVNGLDGSVVEIDPSSGAQIGSKTIDDDRAQQPPGSGDLFGIAMEPSGSGFYYVEDDVNTLVLAH